MIPNVLIEPLLLYQTEWDSTRCAVCHAPKWKYYPFCRSCSIKAQCAHLMEPFREFRGISSADLAEISGDQDLKMFEHYDRARDFLTAVHAGRAHARRKSHNEEE